MNGWFPRYSPDGSRLTSERPFYYQAQWLDDTREIAHDGRVILIDGQPTNHPSPNELSAGGGRWAAWRPGVGVYTSWGGLFPLGGCPTVNPEGEFFYVDDRQADTKSLMHGDLRIATGGITDVRASRTALVWTMNGRTWGRRATGLASEIQAAPAEFRPIPIDTPDGPWVLNHTHTGIVLRPFGETHGYRYDNGGQTFYPDAVYGDGAIRVIFTDSHGQQAELSFSLSAYRVDLRAPVVVTLPPAPPIETPPAPTPDPEPVAMESKRLPDDVHAIVVALHAANLTLAKGTDDQRRELQQKICETVCARKGPRWVWKSNHGIGIANAKDAIAEIPEGDVFTPNQRQRLYIWDLFNGGTREPNRQPVMSEAHDYEQFAVPVQPIDHLATAPSPGTPAPNPGTPAQPAPVDLAPILARIDAQAAVIADTNAALLRLAEVIEKMRIPAPAAVQFPDYRGQLPYLGSITLKPVK
jgi:hypothetical protein